MAFSRRPTPAELLEFTKALDPAVTLPEFDALGEAKAEVRAALAAQQDGLCCYCHDRLDLTDPNATHIEHVRPQSTDPAALRFQWKNLALSCDGGNRRPGSGRHCDHAKGDQPLTFVDPYAPGKGVDDVAELRIGGELRVREGLGGAKTDVDTVLRLNELPLKQRRREALEAQLRPLNAKDASWTARAIQNAASSLRPDTRFAPLLRGWLQRQLTQRP